MEKPC